jgi:hypothetical protein
METRNSKAETRNYLLAWFAMAALVLAALCLLPTALRLPSVQAAPTATVRNVPSVWVVDSPSITIAGATATTTATPSTGAHEAHIQWIFQTVSGSYGTCTAQMKTSYDGGTTWLTLGSAQSITVTSNTVNAWDIYQQAPSTSAVTNTSTSATAATGFGQQTEITFSCSSYGTSAPVTITAIYK